MSHSRSSGMGIVWIMSVFIFMVVPLGWAADDGQSKKTISGTIDDTDWAKSIITVRYSDTFSGNADEIDIIVPEGTKIMNGPESIDLADIEQSDPVTVTYYDDGVGGLKAKRIMDLNAGNR